MTATATDITFLCPHCKQRMAVDGSAGGTKLSCPGCSEAVYVPRKTPHSASHPVNDISFICPHCEQGLIVDSVAAGTRVVCSHCQEGIYVPRSNLFGLERCKVCLIPVSRQAHFCPKCGDPKSLGVPKPIEVPVFFYLVAAVWLAIGAVIGWIVLSYLMNAASGIPHY